MTRDHFNRSRRDSYISSPNFVNTKQYQIEKDIEDTVTSIWEKFLSVPRRFFGRGDSKKH